MPSTSSRRDVVLVVLADRERLHRHRLDVAAEALVLLRPGLGGAGQVREPALRGAARLRIAFRGGDMWGRLGADERLAGGGRGSGSGGGAGRRREG